MQLPQQHHCSVVYGLAPLLRGIVCVLSQTTVDAPCRLAESIAQAVTTQPASVEVTSFILSGNRYSCCESSQRRENRKRRTARNKRRNGEERKRGRRETCCCLSVVRGSGPARRCWPARSQVLWSPATVDRRLTTTTTTSWSTHQTQRNFIKTMIDSRLCPLAPPPCASLDDNNKKRA